VFAIAYTLFTVLKNHSIPGTLLLNAILGDVSMLASRLQNSYETYNVSTFNLSCILELFAW